MVGRAGRDMFPSCFENTKYTCLMCINTSVYGACSVFENDKECSGLKSRQFGGILRENDKINES